MAEVMKSKIVAFSCALLMAVGAWVFVLAPDGSHVVPDVETQTEQIVVKTGNVVLLYGDKPIQDISVDVVKTKQNTGKDKNQLASNDTNVQLWIE